jgi:hypothetical protein
MNARGKLNVAFVNGSILMAIIAGVVCQSWIVFFAVLIGGVLLSLYLGNIRTSPRDRSRHAGSRSHGHHSRG